MNIRYAEMLASGQTENVFDLINYDKSHNGHCCYCICDTVTGLVYVGITYWFKSRLVDHMAKLRNGKHPSKALVAGLAAGNKIVAFIIEEIGEDWKLASACEIYWIGRFGNKCCNRNKPTFLASKYGKSQRFWEAITRFGFHVDEYYVRSEKIERTERVCEKVLRMLNSGSTASEISSTLNLNKNTVSANISYLKKKGKCASM